MYEGVEEVMVESGVAEKLEQPDWMDNSGNVVEEKDAFVVPPSGAS